MIRLEALARLREQAALVRTGAGLRLLGAGGGAEVRRGTAHVVDIALEVGIVGDGPRLLHERVVATRLHDAPLMERERAERALAEAAAAAGEAEPHLLDGRHAAGLLVHRVVRAREGQAVDGVHLGLRKRGGRRVLHDELVVGIRLHQTLPDEGIAVGVLHGEAARVVQGIGLQVGERGQLHRIVDVRKRVRAVDGAVDEREVVDGQARGKRVGYLNHGALPHAEAHEVGPGVQQDGALHLVRPVVVVREPPQARLDAAQHDGRLLERAADEVAVDDGRVVRAQARLPARRVRVLAAALPGHGVVVHHGVHIAGRHEERQPRLAERSHRGRVVPVGLRDDAHLVAVRLQKPRDDGRAERGVVDVRVARHVDEVDLVPAAFRHILTVHREKLCAHGTPCRRAGRA